MGKIVTVTVPMPTNGMTNDPRDPDPRKCRVCTNFDIVTDRRRAIPYFDSESGNADASVSLMQAWTIAKFSASEYRLYGLGRQDASNKVRIFHKALTTGASTDLDDSGWTETANNTEATQTTPSYDLFVYYPKTNYIYGAHAGRYIYRYDPDGTDAFAGTHVDLTAFTNIAQGVVHSQDDILYVPYDNKIAKNDNGSWTNAALTLPTEFYITSICEYGSYLAIACAPLSGLGRSRVYLWDKSSTLATLAANIDWGVGIIKVLEELQGYLIGVSLVSGLETSGRYRIVFKYYAGASGAIQFQDFSAGSLAFNLRIAKQKINNRIYFMAAMTLNGAVRDGVWSISNAGEGFAVTHERTTNNDTIMNANGVLRSFFIVGNYVFMAFVDNSSVHIVNKTNDTESYTATSIIETTINPNMPSEDRTKKKTLLSVGATYDSLPTAGSIVVKGRVNEASSYTTIFTETTDSAVKTEPAIVPSAGTYLDSGHEFEFQINSTGGAVPTALVYKYEVLEGND